MNESVLFTQLTTEQLTQMIVSGVRNELERFKESVTPKSGARDVMTLKEVCDYLGVCKTTLFNWEQKGILIPSRIEGVVRYKRKEVEILLGFGDEDN